MWKLTSSSPPVSSITISLVLNANVSLCWACFDVSEGKYADGRELMANQHFVTQLQDHFFELVDGVIQFNMLMFIPLL